MTQATIVRAANGVTRISDIPQQVKEFLIRHIQSVWQIEVLMLLQREAEKNWTADRIAQVLYMNADAVQAGLQTLVRSGVLNTTSESPTTYSVNSSNTQAMSAISQLSGIYTERRLGIINLIFQKPLQSFSDAFSLRPEEDQK